MTERVFTAVVCLLACALMTIVGFLLGLDHAKRELAAQIEKAAAAERAAHATTELYMDGILKTQQNQNRSLGDKQ